MMWAGGSVLDLRCDRGGAAALDSPVFATSYESTRSPIAKVGLE